VTRADPQNSAPATRTLAARPGSGPACARDREVVVVSLDVLPAGVGDLRRAGWLTGRSDDDSVADAVLALLQRALALRVRP
jgi:hypothetical protein